MTRSELRAYIKRQLGYPNVRVEISDDQLDDSIIRARKKFIKWATGNASQERFITMMLSGGQHLYDLPTGVLSVIDCQDEGKVSGINTLFTVENQLYNQGILNPFTYSSNFGLIGYHTALDFLETLEKYTTSSYSYYYHSDTNQLEIAPTPPTGSTLYNTTGDVYDSPGWVLLRTFMLRTATLSTSSAPLSAANDPLLEEDWVQDYALALSKIILGRILRKFESFASIGNAGIALDGASLIDEGKQEKEILEEKLQEEETFTGWPIIVG